MINLVINGNDELLYLKDYIIDLDKWDIQSLNNDLVTYSIEQLLEKQLIRLDCSRIVDGLRMMQTIGFPYRDEITKYIYYLNNINFLNCDNVDNFDTNYWIHKLLDLHASNLAFEQENPPVWYAGKKGKNEFEKKYNKKESKSKAKPKSKEEKLKDSLALKLAGSAFSSFKINRK